jgi:hypothetical protein
MERLTQSTSDGTAHACWTHMEWMNKVMSYLKGYTHFAIFFVGLLPAGPLHAGPMVLADAGYSNPPGIAAVVRHGADVCVRLNRQSLPLWDAKGLPFPLLQKVRKREKAEEIAEWRLWVQSGNQRIAGRLCGIRKSEAAVQRAQRKLTRKQQDGKGKDKDAPENREYACYVLVFTTLPKNRATVRQVLECYRLRWQIELSFKRLKSIVDLGHVPKRDDQSSRASLYGKLFVAL